MAGTGQALGAIARGADLGLGIAQRLKAGQRAEEDQAFQDEARQRQRTDWKVQDEERGRIAGLRRLGAIGEAVNAGGPVAPEIQQMPEYQDIMFALNPGFEEAKATAFHWFNGDMPDAEPDDPRIKKAGDVLHAKDYSSRIGRIVDADYKLPDGTSVPKGAKIETVQTNAIFPMKGKEGKYDSYAVEMKIGFRLPNGDLIYGLAPATENGDVSDKAKVAPVPFRGLMERISNLDQLVEAAKTPAVKAMLKQKIAAAGGDPSVLDKHDYDSEKVQAELAKIGAETELSKARADAAKRGAVAAEKTAQAALERARRPVGGAGGGKDGRTAFERNAEFIATTMFRSVKDPAAARQKAIEYLNTAKTNPEQARTAGKRLAAAEKAGLVKEMEASSGDRKKALKLKIETFDLDKRAQDIGDSILASATEPNAGADYSGAPIDDDDAFLDSVLGD